MITLLHFSNLVITNDSGPMHLSATLGKDLIALFGPTNPQRFGPYPITHPRHRIFKSDAIVDISVESVLKTVKDIFARRDQAIPKSVQPNLYLVGFMGTGKSMLGRFLAKILKMQFIDSDEFIEVKERMSVEEIFEHKGEAYLREQESIFFLNGHPSYGCVVACGGAISLSQDIIVSLKSKGIVIGLFASSEKILQQTNRKSHRPLLNSPDMNQKQRIEELLSQHEKFYMSAHYCLNSEGRSPLELSKRIVHLYTQKFHS